MGDKTPGPGSRGGRFGEEIEGEKVRVKRKGRYKQESNGEKGEIKDKVRNNVCSRNSKKRAEL